MGLLLMAGTGGRRLRAASWEDSGWAPAGREGPHAGREGRRLERSFYALPPPPPRRGSALGRSLGPEPEPRPRWAGRAWSTAPFTASETQLPTSSSPRRGLLSEQEAASSLASRERTWGLAGRPTDPPQGPACPTPPRDASAPHQVLQPQHYLWALEFPELPEDARATSWDLGATVRGASILPFSSSRPVPGAPPGGRAWWFSIGAPWLGTSEKMPAMRLFTCFLQLLAGLALPAVPPQVRPAPTAQPGSPDLPTLSTQSRRSAITDPLPRAALLRMPTHFSGDRLDHVVWEETSGWAVLDSSSRVCLGGGREATGKGGRFPVWPL